MVDERRIHAGTSGDGTHAALGVAVLGEDAPGRVDDLGSRVGIARPAPATDRIARLALATAVSHGSGRGPRPTVTAVARARAGFPRRRSPCYKSSVMNYTDPDGNEPGSPRKAPTTAEHSALGRLAGWCYDHRRRVLLVWIAIIIAITVVAQSMGSRFQDSFGSGNSASQQVQNLLAARFPQTAGTSADVVIATTGLVDSPSNRSTTDALVAKLSALPHVSEVRSPFNPADHQISSNRHIAFAVVQFDQQASTIPNAAVRRVIDVAESFDRPGYKIALGGGPIGNVITAAPGPSEGAGILGAMLIMLIAFGSVVAMGLPILTALFGIAVGFALEDLLSHVLNVPIFAPEMLAMIGLGVGIDYALFIVTRYRQGLFEGRDPRGAVATALATSGRAVLFAGTTVVISLVGLFLLQLPFLQGLAVGTIAAVLLVMAAALTLLPSMLGFAGRAIDRMHLPRLLQTGATPAPDSFWYRWSRAIQRRPWRWGILALLALVALAIPLFSMRLAFTDASNDPTSLTTRQAFDLLAEGFGPGFNGPLVVAAPLSSAEDSATMNQGGRRPCGPPRHRLRGAGRDQRRQQRSGDHRLSDHGARGRPDLPTRHDPAIHGHPPRHRRDRVEGAGRRGDRGERGRLELPLAPTALGDHRRDRARLLVADGGLPLGGDPGQGGDHEPAVGGCCLRGHRGRLPVGLGWVHRRDRPHRPDRPLDPADDVHHPLRAVDGLRSLPAQSHA